MSFWSTSFAWLADTLQDNWDPYTATYTDDSSGTAISLTVWLGRTVFAQNIEGKGRIEFGELDVFVRADELLVSGAKISPAKGDRIALTLNGTAVTLELMTPSSGEPPWRYSDPQRELFRIHCKRVA